MLVVISTWLSVKMMWVLFVLCVFMMEVSMKEFDDYLTAYHHLTWNPDIIYSLISFLEKLLLFHIIGL